MSVIKRVQSSGALPVARDTTSYNIVMSVLYGGATSGQLDYILKDILSEDIQENDLNVTLDNEELYWNSRSEAKRAHNERVEAQRQVRMHKCLWTSFLHCSQGNACGGGRRQSTQ